LGGKRTEWTNMISWVNIKFPHTGTWNFHASLILKLYNYLARQEIQFSCTSKVLDRVKKRPTDDSRKTTSWVSPHLLQTWILGLPSLMRSVPCGFADENSSCTSSRDSAVGIATGYGLDDWEVGVRVPGRVKNFHFSMSSRPALGSTQPPIQWVLGVLSRG
jgi:hypothetical protein